MNVPDWLEERVRPRPHEAPLQVGGNAPLHFQVGSLGFVHGRVVALEVDVILSTPHVPEERPQAPFDAVCNAGTLHVCEKA